MAIFGYILFVVATLVMFVVPETLYKKGKINTLEELVKIKGIGTGLLFISVIFMILGNR